MNRATATRRPQQRRATAPHRRRFTVDEYYRMVGAGILHEHDRIELLDGEIFEMSPIGGPHVYLLNILTMFFAPRLVGRAIVSVQNPLRLDTRSEPQPDMVLLRPRPARDLTTPRWEEALLVVEVSDTSLRYDRDRKLPFYASAGVPEAWILDVSAERLLVFRSPSARAYTQTENLARGASIAPLAFPDVELGLDLLFP